MLKRRELGLSLLASPFISQRVRAEDSVVRISKQYGLGYLSMMVMEHEHLVERHTAKAGIQAVRTEWSVLGGPGPQIDALLAGQVGFIGPGSTTLATLWDKTAGTGRDEHQLGARSGELREVDRPVLVPNGPRQDVRDPLHLHRHTAIAPNYQGDARVSPDIVHLAGPRQGIEDHFGRIIDGQPDERGFRVPMNVNRRDHPLTCSAHELDEMIARHRVSHL